MWCCGDVWCCGAQAKERLRDTITRCSCGRKLANGRLCESICVRMRKTAFRTQGNQWISAVCIAISAYLLADCTRTSFSVHPATRHSNHKLHVRRKSHGMARSDEKVLGFPHTFGAMGMAEGMQHSSHSYHVNRVYLLCSQRYIVIKITKF